MPGGDGFTPSQRYEIDRAIRDAETVSRLEFSVFVGASEGETGPFARRLHAALTAPERSVLVMVDPASRLLDIVTGVEARRSLDDAAVELVAMSMQACFAAGDLVGGITSGLSQLAQQARKPRMLHAESTD